MPIRLLTGSFIVVLAALLHVAPAQADTTIRCESDDGRWRACPADTRGGVWLSRQLSRAGCWEGDTWGYDRNRIWVTNGCRAEFRVGERRGSSGNGAAIAGAIIAGAIVGAAIANANDHDDHRPSRPPQDWQGSRTFRCESQDQRRAWCGQRIGRRDHVEIRRQLSRGECVYGRSWGIDRGDVWVDDGCRAEFVVY
jgi:hypothetical protein